MQRRLRRAIDYGKIRGGWSGVTGITSEWLLDGSADERATLVRCMIEAGGSEPEHPRIHPPVPSAAGITRMDEALGWIQLIPRDRSVLRRIVGARALVNPLTDRHCIRGGDWGRCSCRP